MSSRRLYLLFLYYVVFEGALRKWIWPSASNELFLVKDVLLTASVILLYGFEGWRQNPWEGRMFDREERALWQIWVVVVFLGFAGAGFSLLGLIGVRYYLVPLLVLAIHPVLARDIDELERFFSSYLLVCLGVCVLGFVQFTSSQDSLINRYSWAPNSEMDIATFGEVAEKASDFTFVRITGTFPYISPYASYLQFMYFAAVGMFVTRTRERLRLWYALIALAVLVNLFMTGSRGPVLVCLVLSVLFLPILRNVFGRRFAIFGVFFSLAAFTSIAWLLRDIAVALIERNEQAGDAGTRIASTLLLPLYTLATSSFFGEGLGSTFLGLGQLTGAAGFEYRFDEVTQDRIAVELGIVGYLFFIFVKLYFLLACWRLYNRANDLRLKTWALVSLSFQASLLWSVPLYNSVAAIFYFFSIAMFGWLRQIERAERRRKVNVESGRLDLFAAALQRSARRS